MRPGNPPQALAIAGLRPSGNSEFQRLEFTPCASDAISDGNDERRAIPNPTHLPSAQSLVNA